MNEPHTSDLAIDRYLAGELSAEDAAAFERRAENDDRLATRLTELRADADATRDALPPLPAAPRRNVPLAAIFALAAGVLLALFVGRSLLDSSGAEQPQPPRVAATRTKGQAHLTLYVRRGERVFTFAGESLHPGDGLAFAYTAPQDGHVALFDLDGTEAACIYPENGTTAPAPAGVDVELDVAVELDGSASQESIVAVFCETPQSTSNLAAALSHAESLPQSCTADRVRLPKEGR